MTRSRFAGAALFYALVMAYVSTVIGVLGPHFVPLGPVEALHHLIHIPYVEHGSDQRSDWMGNVLMAVPLGFFVAGWLSPAARGDELAAAGAFVSCLVFILVLKYFQLFFPPRTVTLNYVMAQSLGAAVGIVAFNVLREPLANLGHGMSRLESLRLVLRIYTALALLFLLMPLDFALSVEDLTAQLDKVPASVFALSGEGRPGVVRIAVILGSVAAMAPIGAMLTLVERGRVHIGRSTADATWIGFCLMAGVYALTCLLITGSPSLPALAFHSFGIALGAWTMRWLARQYPERIRRDLERMVPWAVPIYLLALAAVNGLLSLQWTTPGQAAEAFYGYGLIPLYNYYIVTKPQAAKNIIAHAVMYAPIGVMIWLCAKQEGSRWLACGLAAVLSALVEIGRFLRPSLVPDINAIPLAGASAWAAVALMPSLWRLLSAVSIPLQPAAVDWRDRETTRHARRRDRGNVIGDVEDY